MEQDTVQCFEFEGEFQQLDSQLLLSHKQSPSLQQQKQLVCVLGNQFGVSSASTGGSRALFHRAEPPGKSAAGTRYTSHLGIDLYSLCTWNSGKHKVPVLEITEVKLNGLDLDILEGQAAQRCLCLFSSFFELVSFSINYAS